MRQKGQRKTRKRPLDHSREQACQIQYPAQRNTVSGINEAKMHCLTIFESRALAHGPEHDVELCGRFPVLFRDRHNTAACFGQRGRVWRWVCRTNLKARSGLVATGRRSGRHSDQAKFGLVRMSGRSRMRRKSALFSRKPDSKSRESAAVRLYLATDSEVSTRTRVSFH